MACGAIIINYTIVHIKSKNMSYYCNKYKGKEEELCSKLPNNDDDDWDELEDPCANCCHWVKKEDKGN